MTDHQVPTWDYILKYCIIGDAGVGKTSLLLRLTSDDKSPLRAPEPTIGVDFGSKVLSVGNGKFVKVQCWDTAGAEAFRSITRSYFRGSSGSLLVFDVTTRSTFDNVPSWLKDLRKHADPDVAIMLVANKTDLCPETDPDTSDEVLPSAPILATSTRTSFSSSSSGTITPRPRSSTTRAVSRSEAMALAKAEGLLYVETSAKDGTGVEEAFARTAREVLGRTHGGEGKDGKKKDIVRIGNKGNIRGGCC